MNVHRIVSLDLPPLQPYRTLRRPQEHLEQGIFVAEGEKVTRRFLVSDWQIISLLLTREWLDTIVHDIPPSRLVDVHVFVGEKKLLETIVGFPLHQGIMAVGRVPREESLQEVVAGLPSHHFLVALDGLVQAENVGVVVRNSAGFGVDGIIVNHTCASPYLRRAVRNSMGGIFKVPCVHVDDLATSLSFLKNEFKTNIIIADAHAETSIQNADFSANICIVFGNEDEGVSKEVELAATERVRIPMQNGTDSLNVASASAVMLHEAMKRRD